MSENEITTISISPATKIRLADICHKDKSYDDLINALIDLWVKNKK